MTGPEAKGALMKRAGIASLAVSALLVTIKGFAYFSSHSVSMLASMADSALDLFTSSLNLFAIHSALTPADDEHRFGHGKAEPLAGLAQAAFITASALFLVIQAAQRFLDPQPIENSGQALVIMSVSIAMALGLVLYERHVVSRTRSVAVGADLMHYIGDLATNIGVVVAILLVQWFGWLQADPVIAVLIACVMLATAWGVGRQSLDQLMDRELADEERARIVDIIRRHGAVQNVHDLRTRSAGLTIFIQAHIELDPAMPLAQVHAVSDAVERALCAAYPGAEVIIHQDPAGLEQH